MQVAGNWQPVKSSPGAEVYRVNNIRLARVWCKLGEWQIACDLPDADIKQHLFPSLQAAKDYLEKRIARWFDRVDA